MQPLNFQKHIDLAKLVSWKHMIFEIPSQIIATKFLRCKEDHRNMVYVTQTIVPSPSM